jgi:inorganic pyrophosphatase
MDFWQRADWLLSGHEIIIDRPQGSRHPRYPELVYPLDYGYLKGTTGSDGQAVDVWKGSLSGQRLVAVICTIDAFKADAEIKLLVDCSNTEIDIIDRFYNTKDVMSGLVILRK